MALCDKYEAIFSRTDHSSELYKLNHGALPKDGNEFQISPELAELTAKGLAYGQLSNGAFDIAIAPVSSLWDFTSEEKRIPSDEDLKVKLPLVNYEDVILDGTSLAFDIAIAPVSSLWDFTSEEKRIPSDEDLKAKLPLVNYEDVILDGTSLSFRKDGMGLDLGAIAKGYIADKIKEFLLSKGVKSAIINLGGNVLCIGNKPDKTPFKIGIQKPFADRSETIATVDITNQSVVSSGIYERFFEKDGQLYHHILNPKTGYPYDNSLISVTIICDSSTDGDGLSTSCFALGLEKGMELINSLPDVHAVFITSDDKLHYSKNFQKETSLRES